jgi:hypothetical protein
VWHHAQVPVTGNLRLLAGDEHLGMKSTSAGVAQAPALV